MLMKTGLSGRSGGSLPPSYSLSAVTWSVQLSWLLPVWRLVMAGKVLHHIRHQGIQRTSHADVFI